MTTPYKIGEAAALLNLKSYVLRFWETEFPDIVPLRTEKGQRLYTREHLALLQRIRYLLHDRGLTIGGARKMLAEEKQRGVVYAFQEPGAAPETPPAALSFPLAGHGEEAGEQAGEEAGQEAGQETGEEATVRPSAVPDFDPDEIDAEAFEAEEGAEDEESADADGLCEDGEDDGGPASVRSRPGPARPFSQYNLPGLEELVAMRASVLDSEPVEAYSPVEEPAPAPSPGTQGMLPLFAVARAAYFAGRASGRAGGGQGGLGGSGVGGDNFIHAGAETPLRGPAGTHDAAPHTAHGAPDEFLRALVSDLESVAALLRTAVPIKE